MQLLLNVSFAAHPPKNFEEAKSQARIIWQEHRETFYCGCSYDKYGVIDFKSCSYTPINSRKDKWVSWEHVVPVSWYGKKLDCWKKPHCETRKGKKFKGRNCCRKMDHRFREMEADLHNLVPTIREVNSARENYRFTEFYPDISSEDKYHFNHCPLIIDERYRLFEPRDKDKGMAARISLYMADKYGIDLGERQRKLLTDWSNRFPPSAWEKRWNQKVTMIHGDNNNYIEPEGPIE